MLGFMCWEVILFWVFRWLFVCGGWVMILCFVCCLNVRCLWFW